MGAGLIPFCVRDRQVLFLFHRTFSGRRAGTLVDFGGNAGQGESPRQTAMREFIEETEMMFLAGDFRSPTRTDEGVRAQIAILERLFDHTLGRHPHWWCRRRPGPRNPSRTWATYFIEFGYRDVTGMNREWEMDGGRRFVKRRELLWVPSEELLDMLAVRPDRLWKRVRQLEGMEAVVREIAHYGQGHRQAPI